MNNLQPYDPQSSWLSNISHDNSIDCFFTQRKIVEFDEIIDEKTLDRNKIKKNITQNFLAITFPNNQFKNKTKILVDIEIWGDKSYNYRGKLENITGDSPHVLVKLDDDTELFVKLITIRNCSN